MPIAEVRWSQVDGLSSGDFEDALGKTHRVAETVQIGKESCVLLGRAPSPLILTREQVKMLLPHLQAFVEVGRLEPKATPRT